MHSSRFMHPDPATLSCPKDDQVSRPREASTAAAMNLTLSSRSETEALGKTIGGVLVGGELLALIGEIGAGKTTLIRGIAAGLGVPPASVSSPTFVLIHEYRGRLPFIHIDLYRLNNCAEAGAIGLEDYLTGPAVTAIEWADRFLALFPEDRLEVRLSHWSLDMRRVCLAAQGPQSRALLTRIKLAWQQSTTPRQTTRPGRRKARRS